MRDLVAGVVECVDSIVAERGSGDLSARLAKEKELLERMEISFADEFGTLKSSDFRTSVATAASASTSMSTSMGPADEGELELMYDPVLNCYFDPRTKKYYKHR